MSFDRQDFFTVLGLALLHTGVACIYWPAALILGGLFCLSFVIFLERTRTEAAPEAASETNAGPRLIRDSNGLRLVRQED